MRKLGVDELPQLANVLKSDMSLAWLRPQGIAQPGHATMTKFTGSRRSENH